MDSNAKDDPYDGVRAVVEDYLPASAFPSDAANLMAVARQNDATDDVLRMLNDLPTDMAFESLQDALEQLPLHRWPQENGPLN